MKIGYICIIIFFENTIVSQMEKQSNVVIITNYKENCDINYDMLVSMTWNQQILPYFHKQLTELKFTEEIENFYTEFNKFLIEYFVYDDKECLFCTNHIYEFFIENYDFFNELNLDEFRQDLNINFNVMFETSMKLTYIKYYDFMQKNKKVIIQKKTLFNFYVLQHYIDDHIDHLSKSADIHVEIISIHYTHKVEENYLYDHFSKKIFLDNDICYALGIFIDPGFDYYNLCYHVVYHLHDLVNKLINFIDQICSSINLLEFESIDFKLIIPSSFLPIYAEESFYKGSYKEHIKVLTRTYALKKSISDSLTLILNLIDHIHLFNPRKYRCQQSMLNFKLFDKKFKNFNDVELKYKLDHFSNYTNETSNKDKLINVNVSLVEYITNKITSKTISLELLQGHENIYFDDQKMDTKYDFFSRICQTFFKTISMYLMKLGFEHYENSFTFYTYVSNVLRDIEKEGIFTFEILKNFYNTYIEQTIDFNINTEPININIIHKKIAKANLSNVSKEEQMCEVEKSFDSMHFIHLNTNYTNPKTGSDEKEINLSDEDIKIGDNADHSSILKCCVYNAIYVILYNCSIFKEPTEFHMLLNELNFYINKPNLCNNNQHTKKSMKEISFLVKMKDIRYLETIKTMTMVNKDVSTYHIWNYYYLKCKESHQFDDKEKLKIQNDINKMFKNYYFDKKTNENYYNHVFVMRVFVLNCTCSCMFNRMSVEISDEYVTEFILLTIENYIKANKERLPEYFYIVKSIIQ
ncbi:hypothetical protein COBT_002500, partial [Conglomerata obtusa]